MSEPPIARQLIGLLVNLEKGLRCAGYWSDTPPSEKAMLSTAPFACDTMTFQQWLQFLLIPKLSALIDAQQPLPSNIALVPMAEQTLPDTDLTAPVFQVLDQIDRLLSGQVG